MYSNKNTLGGVGMRRLKLAIFWSALLTWQTAAFALGLGPATVESFLNQPLDARISLLDLRGETVDTLSAKLASADDYALLGLSTEGASVPLNVNIQSGANGPYIRVTTRLPVQEPIYQFVLDVGWSSGRMLKEYTLFLDPPTVPVRPVSAPVSESATVISRSPGAASGPAQSAGSRPSQIANLRASDTEYGPVASGDTLWRITSQRLPDGYDINQAMVAIVQLNPQAFVAGDMNRLRRGAILRLPELADLDRVSRSDADRIVAQQTAAWRQANQAAAATPRISEAGAAADTTGQTQAGDSSQTAEAPRLELVPPVDEPSDVSGSAGVDTGGGVTQAQLRARLAQTEEELINASATNVDLQEQLAEAQQVIGELRQALNLEDADLAQLQERLRQQRAVLDEAAEDTAAADAAVESENVPDIFDNELVGAGVESESDQIADAESLSEAAGSDTGAADAGDTDVDSAAAPSLTDLAERARDGSQTANAVDSQAADTAASPVSTTATPGSAGQRTEQPFWKRYWYIWPALLLLALLSLWWARRGERSQEYDAPGGPGLAASLVEANEPADTEAADSVGAEQQEAADTELKPASENIGSLTEEAEEILRLLEEEEASSAEEELFDDEPSDEEPSFDSQNQDVPDILVEVGDASEHHSDFLHLGIQEEDEDAVDFSASVDTADQDTIEEDPFEQAEEQPEEQAETDHDEAEEDATAETEDETEGETIEEASDNDDFDSDDADNRGTDSDLYIDGEAGGEEAQEADGDELSQTEDQAEVKLDLARAYLSMDDQEAARALIEEVIEQGAEAQQAEARKMLDEL